MLNRTHLVLPLVLIACGGRSETSPGGDDGTEFEGTGDGDGDPSGGGSAVGGSAVGGTGQGGFSIGGNPPTGGTGSGGGATSTGGAPGAGGAIVAGGTGGSALEPAEVYCEQACQSASALDGGCAEVLICPEDGECLERADRWTTEARVAFEWCLENDPMCFISAEGCMLDRLFEGGPYRFVIGGSSFPIGDGTLVALETEQEVAITQMVGGAFEAEIQGNSTGDYAEPVLVWIDQNADTLCNEGDSSRYVSPDFNGDFAEPLFVSEVNVDEPAANLVCPESM